MGRRRRRRVLLIRRVRVIRRVRMSRKVRMIRNKKVLRTMTTALLTTPQAPLLLTTTK